MVVQVKGIKNFGLKQISTGDLLRNEITQKSDLGKKTESIINKGELVSDLFVNKLIAKELSNKKYYNKFIFDGYPRTLSQAISLEDLLNKFSQKIKESIIA